RLIALDSVDSTNEEAKRRAREGAEDGTLIWALEQTAGRGRGGRQWASPRGNLYCSVLTRPDCALSEAAQLGFAACLGVGGALGSVVPPLTQLNYKWPNDVLLNGRKVAGILLETSSNPEGGLEWLIVGIGVNVASHPEDTEFPATSLAAVGAGGIEVSGLLEAFCRRFQTWVNRWLDEGFAPLRRAWVIRAKGIGEPIEARLGNGSTIAGVFDGLDDRGALILKTEDGATRTIDCGEVYFGTGGD
ncbi:MAG: biotin--[acetyl-CoA-carboxylase] ligase, partial [Kiloniellales bacterium]